MARESSSIVGFAVLGRHGALGIVVDLVRDGDEESAVVVRGGLSDALLYYVPASRISSVSPERRTVVVDLDLADFDSSLREDGTIELRALP